MRHPQMTRVTRSLPTRRVGGTGYPLGVPPKTLLFPPWLAAPPPTRAGKRKTRGGFASPNPTTLSRANDRTYTVDRLEAELIEERQRLLDQAGQRIEEPRRARPVDDAVVARERQDHHRPDGG